MKKILIVLLIALMFTACRSMDIYKVAATATAETITGRDVNGDAVTLTLCKAENGRRMLLENVTPGRAYIVTIDSCGTWNTEDDEILKIQEVKR